MEATCVAGEAAMVSRSLAGKKKCESMGADMCHATQQCICSKTNRMEETLQRCSGVFS
jgi:hypothetical protein